MPISDRGKHIQKAYDTAAWIMKCPGLTRKQLELKTGFDATTVFVYLRELRAAGLVNRKRTKNGYVYFFQPSLFEIESDK